LNSHLEVFVDLLQLYINYFYFIEIEQIICGLFIRNNSIIKQVFTKQLGTKINYTLFKAITTWLQQNFVVIH